MNKFLLSVSAALLMVCSSARVSAADFSFTGNFSADDDVQLFEFTADASSTVVFRTWSFAGGVNAAGALIPNGGFDPILTLFDSTGLFIANNDDDADFSAVDTASENQYDSYLEIILDAGTYTLSITQFPYFAVGPNLSNGFGTSTITGFGGRDSHWAVDVLNVDTATPVAAVPEPGSYALMLLGLGVFSVMRHRNAKQ